MNVDSRILEQAIGQPGETPPRWDFLTNHAHVLLCVSQDSGIRLRDIAAAVGITERGAHKVLSELVDEGYVLRERHGRRNRYKIKPELPLRHPLVQERQVGELLAVLTRSETVDRRVQPDTAISARAIEEPR
jgi:DNA-binding MarR family transcriptional regulator